MAQKRKQKRNKRWLYWLIMLILFAGAVAVCYFVWDAYFGVRDNNDDSSEVVTEDDKEKEEKTEENPDDSEGAEGTGNSEGSTVVEKEKIIQYEGGDPNEAKELTGAVTYAGVSGGVLMIRANIDQFITSGKCELTLSRGGATIYRSIANIMGSVTTSVCDGFDVPVTELGGGEIDININISADGRVGSLRGKANI